MKQYKGYYIDNVKFNSEKEIDEFIKQQAIERFLKLNKLFANNATLECSKMCSEQARLLHDKFNLSYDEIEMLELKAIA